MSKGIPAPTPAIGGGLFWFFEVFWLGLRRVYLVILGIGIVLAAS